ncbi:sensor histidine kinase [Arthrobacter sp. AQ5-05]|uniref:sensor histidine kinase n=1 Tax=Arthrobacter sp. AQ5-05 TaxID=2184581 RepID=UPI000DCD3380|nr:HAMP domain-containing sensor histidine kinase [Arthrobacter sp. AQ5-05]RAX47402.1 sensor histidine kinase [Arthrobacter sp. AQ5-05]
MKLRVLGVLSVLALLLVLIVSNVILSSAGRELTSALQINRAASLNRIAQVAFDAATDSDTTVLQRDMDTYSGLYDEGLVVRLQSGTLVSGGLDPERPDVRDALARASLNLSDTALDPVTPLGSGTEVISRSFGSASQVLGEAVMEVNLDAARAKLRTRWLATGVAAIALATLLLLLAGRVTGWVLRPVQRLGAAVRELKDTGRTSRLPEAGPPELRELSRSFTAMAATLGEVIESQRQLIADTSHHLRNPVGALRLRVDLLLLKLKNKDEREAGAGVLAELERVEEILDSVLRLAVAEHRVIEDSAGTAPGELEALVPSGVNALVVLAEEVDRARPAASKAGNTITLAPEQDPGIEIDCNRIELAQMLGELLNNAIKYAPGAEITAEVLQVGSRIIVEIADNGPGLAPAQLAAATTRFWRAPEHASIRGTGMGMTIVDKLATANGGHLVLGSNKPHGLRARIVFDAVLPGQGQQDSR